MCYSINGGKDMVDRSDKLIEEIALTLCGYSLGGEDSSRCDRACIFCSGQAEAVLDRINRYETKDRQASTEPSDDGSVGGQLHLGWYSSRYKSPY